MTGTESRRGPLTHVPARPVGADAPDGPRARQLMTSSPRAAQNRSALPRSGPPGFTPERRELILRTVREQPDTTTSTVARALKTGQIQTVLWLTQLVEESLLIQVQDPGKRALYRLVDTEPDPALITEDLKPALLSVLASGPAMLGTLALQTGADPERVKATCLDLRRGGQVQLRMIGMSMIFRTPLQLTLRIRALPEGAVIPESPEARLARSLHGCVPVRQRRNRSA